jgi:hypothetical protein
MIGAQQITNFQYQVLGDPICAGFDLPSPQDAHQPAHHGAVIISTFRLELKEFM